MARIPDEQLQRLKDETSIERLVTAAGVQLKKKGNDLVGCCPFHEDDTPSLVVTPAKNLWHCMGACQQGGSVIDWVMRSRGVSFRHAVELLREDHTSLAADPTAERRGGRQKGVVPEVSQKRPLAGEAFHRSAADEELLQQVADFYHQSLKQSERGRAYLEQRGLCHAEMLAHFRIGFADRRLGYRLPPRRTAEGDALRDRLTALGVYRKTGHEHLGGSIVVPVFGADGRVLEMYGRKISDNLRKGTPKHVYLPGPHRGVFNLAGVADAEGEVILCEALFDAMAFWAAGLVNVTSSYGTAGFTADHRQALREHGIERVYIAYDRDKAGDAAADKLSAELSAMGIESFRVLFPKGMDACDYARKVTPARQGLRLAVQQAQWMAVAEGAPVSSSFSRSSLSRSSVGRSSEGRASSSAPLSPPPAAPAASPVQAREAAGAAGGGPVQSHEARVKAAERRDEPTPLPSEPAVARVSAKPSEPSTEPVVDEATGEVRFVFGARRWRVRGLGRKAGPESLRVNLFVEQDGGFHVDTLELYAAKQRAAFVAIASSELGLDDKLIKKDLGRVLLGLEQLRARAAEQAGPPGAPEMSEQERDEALELLRRPDLIDRLMADFDVAGLVGERQNKLLGYLATVSRKLASPLAVVIQSSSAAGKSSLMDAILSFVPDEDRIQYSAMTGQSLFYMGEQDLRHRILAIVEEEGAERASYALKLLQSEGELTIASTGKNPTTGRLVTQEYRVEGPVMIMLTTTAIDVDEELLNRCLVLTVDESQAQTRAIHAAQRRGETLAGLLEQRERRHLRRLHQNAQRLLRPLCVINPHAERLRFFDHKTRTRRDHTKYLTLIRTIALLHQHQRPIKTATHRGERIEYLEVDERDIALADELCRHILARGIDELPPQTRRLLADVEQLVTARAAEQGCEPGEVVFSRRDVRLASGWSHAQLKVHLRRLAELEYVAVVAGGPRQRMLYHLTHTYDPNWEGAEPSGRGLVGEAPRPDSVRQDAPLGQLVALEGPRGEGDDETHVVGEPTDEVTAEAVAAS